MKYSTIVLLAVQLATYVNAKPIPAEEAVEVEHQELEFHELQAFFKRAAESSSIPASENPFKTEELSTELPDETLFGRAQITSIPASENPFKTEDVTTDLPDETLFGRDTAAQIPAEDNPFKTEELSTEIPDETMFGKRAGGVQHPRNLRRKAADSTNKTFDLPQVSNPKHQVMDGQSAYIKAYGKFSKDVPPSIKDAAKSNSKLKQKLVKQTGSVAASSPKDYESEFVIPVEIGTPPQTVYLCLDTGSADLWTFSTDTPKKAAQGHMLYAPKNSSTSKLLSGQNWKISYADGSGASGIVYTDKVQIGNTYVETQSVESAVKVSSDFAADTFSNGILGMSVGGNTVRPTKQKTYMDNVQDTLESPIFTANLQKEKPGTYQFGYVDDTAFTGSIQYTPTDKSSQFWKLTSTGYQVGSKGTYKKATIPAIVDTGTTLLLLPSDVVKAYYKGIKGAYFDPWEGMYTFPCKTVLPDFIFGIDSYRGLVPGSYINYGNADFKRCYGGIQSSDGIGVAIFGDILLKAQYVVFDYGNKQIGFANKLSA